MKKTISVLLLLILFVCIVSMFSACNYLQQGETGNKGEDGRGILKVEIIDGYLWITYTDDPNTPVNAGKVMSNDSYTDHFVYQINEDGETCSIVGLFNCMDTELVIPSAYKGLPITKIGAQAFKDCSFIKSVVLPDSVTEIGDAAFDGCNNITNFTGPAEALTFSKENLTTVKITNSTSIPSNTFFECTTLTTITIPESVTSIEYRAFYGCTALTNITIPSSVTSIGEDAFYGCSQIVQVENGVSYVDRWAVDCDNSLTSVTWRDNTLGIGNKAISNCSSLIHITIPNHIIHISTSAISNCQALSSITVADDNPTYYSDSNCIIERNNKVLIVGCNNSIIPQDITRIGDFAFDYCKTLSNVTIPDNITSIGVFAFQWSSLENITIPNGVTVLERAVFAHCHSLTNVTLSKNITSIDDYAFWYCGSLKDIAIPSSVTNIGYQVFRGSGVKSIRFEGTIQQWNDINKDPRWNDQSGVTEIICSDGSINATNGIIYYTN